METFVGPAMYERAEAQRPGGLRIASSPPADGHQAPSPPGTYLAPPPQLLTPAMLARMILRRKLLVAACALSLALCGLAWGMLAPARYMASAQLIIDPTDLRVTDRSLRTPSQLPDAMVAQVENQVRVIVSESVVRKLIADENLEADPEFNGTQPDNLVAGWIASLRALVSKPSEETVSPLLTVQRALSQALGAKREERTFVVNVSALTRDPDKSVRLANGLVNAYLAETAEARDSVSKRIAGALTSRIAELRQDVEQNERRVEDYKRANNIVSAVGDRKSVV